MIYPIFCMKDELVGFMTPTLDQNEASALRNFRHAIASTDGVLHTHPDNFSLWFLGTFNNETGELLPDSPQLLMRGDKNDV